MREPNSELGLVLAKVRALSFGIKDKIKAQIILTLSGSCWEAAGTQGTARCRRPWRGGPLGRWACRGSPSIWRAAGWSRQPSSWRRPSGKKSSSCLKIGGRSRRSGGEARNRMNFSIQVSLDDDSCTDTNFCSPGDFIATVSSTASSSSSGQPTNQSRDPPTSVERIEFFRSGSKNTKLHGSNLATFFNFVHSKRLSPEIFLTLRTEAWTIGTSRRWSDTKPDRTAATTAAASAAAAAAAAWSNGQISRVRVLPNSLFLFLTPSLSCTFTFSWCERSRNLRTYKSRDGPSSFFTKQP